MFIFMHATQHIFESLECLTLYDKSPVTKRDDPLSEVLEVSDDVLQRLVPSSGFRIWRNRAAARESQRLTWRRALRSGPLAA